ncbi:MULTISPECIES: sialidase family protein [unclassified Oceanispirochaeta]|uniref:sialidase family protein n=1 Tax=unclassified Oceanispirochaeta TaxID=2635722 RepID=UPI000E08E2DD|nr:MULTISPECIES: sialidase family protein [unclassified Oceanispirochaeta]MBF9014425.1 exo-alpha-sialidase [Oceanispirochaeta sp. M2]NPD74979.1 exo-alpha-sialidase [Oceanispirochaeta sp. M1]RDG29155.1 exo-alpha-sialidase [Oceanispirochaeta sp. M1]
MKKSLLFLLLSASFLLLSCQTEYDDLDDSDVAGRSKIHWVESSLRKVSALSNTFISLSYPRLEELNDGSLLLVYESVSHKKVMLSKSVDGGYSWSEATVVFSGVNQINPSVPEIIELSEGTLLMAVNYRPEEPYSVGRNFSIAVKISRDSGESWGVSNVLYEGGHEFENGCWEPSFLELPGGEIQLYFADEAPYTNSDEQNISILRSFDKGLSWSREPEIVSFREGGRDGMPVPLFLEDRNQIILGIEDKNVGAFKPSILTEGLVDSWRPLVVSYDYRRSYMPLATEVSDSVYMGAPYLQRLPSGEVLLSMQTNYERGGDWDLSHQMVLVGDASGQDFAHPSYPFAVPLDKRALWNSIEVLSDGRIIALTSTNAYSDDGSVEIWIIDGYAQ